LLVGFRAFGVLALFGGVGYAMMGGALAHHLDHPTAVLVSGPSPFSNCHNRRSDDTSYLNSEVEPFVASNPTSLGTGRVNLVAVWQQDRLLHGLAAGIGSAFPRMEDEPGLKPNFPSPPVWQAEPASTE
jgi:hypothetical protein